MHVGLVSFADIESGLDLANTLNKVGASVSLYLSHAVTARLVGTPNRPIERLYELELLPPSCRVRLFKLPRLRDPRSFAVIRRLRRTMRSDEVDVAHIMMGPVELWLAVLACLVRDIPVISTMIHPKPDFGEERPAFVELTINKLLALGADVVIVNGANQVALVQKLYGLPASRIIYVPLNPRITATKWTRGQQSEEQGTVLFFGRALPHKGLEYLLQAQPIINSQIPHARILIAVHGKGLERYWQMIQDRNKFEIHEGFVSGNEMAAFYQRACLVALPYVSASTSGVLMDAYNFGKPVVATSVGCLPEYVREGITGFLVPPFNVEQLAAAIIRLLSNDDLRHDMGNNALRFVGEQQKKIAIQSMRIYEKAISLHKKR